MKHVKTKKQFNGEDPKSSNNPNKNIDQKSEIELKRFRSHEVYLVNACKPKKKYSIKDERQKRILINPSVQTKPIPKKSTTSSTIQKSTSKEEDNPNCKRIKQDVNVKSKSKVLLNVSKINSKNMTQEKIQNKILTNKILNEESIQELDSDEYNNINILNIDDRPKKYLNKNKKSTNNNTININYNNINTKYLKQNNNIQNNLNIDNQNNLTQNINMNINYYINNSKQKSSENNYKNRELLINSKKGDKEKVLELLHDKNININFQNENGWSALHYACDEGNLKIVDILIKAKINLNLSNNEKKTPLHLSVIRGYFDISKILIENGSNINCVDNEKNLPIHLCAMQGHDELLNYLLEKDYNNINIKNLFGKTVYDVALKESSKSIIKKYLNILFISSNKVANYSKEKEKNSLSPHGSKKKFGDTNLYFKNNKLNQSKNNKFSRVKIHKTNKSKIKSLMIPINKQQNNSITSKNKLNNNNENISIANTNNINKKSSNEINEITTNINTNLVSNDINLNNNNNSKKIKGYKKLSSKLGKNTFKCNTIDIDLTNLSNKININSNNFSNKNKCKAIFNINSATSPNKDSKYTPFNTSSNTISSSMKIHSTNNNTGNDIFCSGNTIDKLINIPKKQRDKIKNINKNDSYSQNKNKKIKNKTITKQGKNIQKISPNIKCLGKNKKSPSQLFKKENSKLFNAIPSQRTISVPRFLDTESILEKPFLKKLKGSKEKKSNKDENKAPKLKQHRKSCYNNISSKIDISNFNNNENNNIDINNRQIYTEEGINLIDDLDEETDINEKKEEIKTNKEENEENFDDIEELEDSFDNSEDSLNLEEKIGPSNFVCLALLGQGSFGEVYLVKKKDSEDYYAMKVLDKCRIAKQNIFKYVLTERNVLSIIHHPFIVKLNYAFQTSEKLFLLLDYCPGGDLSKQLQIQVRFSEEKAKFYICEIILALGELHKNNIIFRDLKPDNVVIDKEGHALLTDFGLSREGVIGKEIAKSFCGSIAYLAPEMLNRCGHGKAVDWYLLGVLFYELLVGVPPYFTNNQEQIFRNIQNAELYIPNFISEKAQKLIKSLLERNPNNRLGSKMDVEEIKNNEYFYDVDWQMVYDRKYKPPQIYLNNNHLQFFRHPMLFKENEEEDDLFIKDNSGNNMEYSNNNKYGQDILNCMNKYEGWSFVQKDGKNNKEINDIKDDMEKEK